MAAVAELTINDEPRRRDPAGFLFALEGTIEGWEIT